MTYQVIFSPAAAADLERLFDHVLARELNSPTGDLDIPARSIDAIEWACQFLAHSPFSCRKVGGSAFVRELIISLSGTGYVALFEILDSQQVIVGAVRHQFESDYHCTTPLCSHKLGKLAPFWVCATKPNHATKLRSKRRGEQLPLDFVPACCCGAPTDWSQRTQGRVSSAQ